MKQGCLISIGFIFLIVLSFIIWLQISMKKPTSSEKMIEILNNEFESTEILENTDLFIELVDVLNKFKKEILNAIQKEVTFDCSGFFNMENLTKYTNLPNNFVSEYNLISAKFSGKNISIQICNNKGITIRVFDRIDSKNYLYIYHEFYEFASIKRAYRFTHYKERLILGKHLYIIGITDAFSIIDPNNFAPN